MSIRYFLEHHPHILNKSKIPDLFRSSRPCNAIYRFYLENQTRKYHHIGDMFWFDFQGKNGKWRCRAEMNETNQEFCFYSRYVDDVPENKRIDMAQFLTRANHYLSLGNFDLDWGYKTLSYKTSIRLPGIWSQENPLNQELLKQLVTLI
jgi:hypothetical protein